jgi:hypothetical protein
MKKMTYLKACRRAQILARNRISGVFSAFGFRMTISRCGDFPQQLPDHLSQIGADSYKAVVQWRWQPKIL